MLPLQRLTLPNTLSSIIFCPPLLALYHHIRLPAHRHRLHVILLSTPAGTAVNKINMLILPPALILSPLILYAHLRQPRLLLLTRGDAVG